MASKKSHMDLAAVVAAVEGALGRGIVNAIVTVVKNAPAATALAAGRGSTENAAESATVTMRSATANESVERGSVLTENVSENTPPVALAAVVIRSWEMPPIVRDLHILGVQLGQVCSN